jgi:DNA-binding MarR family transcriptional regulator
MMISPLSKETYEQLAEFRYIIRKFLRFSESAVKNLNITPQQYLLLLAIKGYPGRDFATPGELAERLQITHHACVELINRCEELELVKRRTNPEDRRSVLVDLTLQGGDILETLAENHLEEIKRIGLFKVL